mgnify:CR=1 FL=1
MRCSPASPRCADRRPNRCLSEHGQLEERPDRAAAEHDPEHGQLALPAIEDGERPKGKQRAGHVHDAVLESVRSHRVADVPVFDTMREAVAATGANARK